VAEWKLAERLTIRELADFGSDARHFLTSTNVLQIDASEVAQVDILGLQAFVSLSSLLTQSDGELQVAIGKGGAIDTALVQFGFCPADAGLPAPYIYQDVAA